jgi:23S rRNA (guanosine2251-2'-O)-methyltransferase
MDTKKPSGKSKNFIYGTRVIMEAIEAGAEIEKVLFQKGSSSEHQAAIIIELRKRNIPFQRVPAMKLDAITRKNHQGTIAFLSSIQYASLDHIVDQAYSSGSDPLILILDRITDVRNLGAIARTAECAGVHALVIQDRGNAMISADAMKTSAGALHHLPVCRVKDLIEALSFLKESGLKLIAASEKGNTTIFQLNMKGPAGIILGSEENGIEEKILRKAEHKAKIPITGQIQSLNVSVAAGIMLYEIVRQRTV